MTTITKADHIDELRFKQLRQLAQACEAFDHALPYMYWEIIARQRIIPCNLFCYDQDRLVAYMTFFHFEKGCLHILAIVHPEFRQQGVFKNMLREAMTEMLMLSPTRTTFSFPASQQAAANLVRGIGAVFSHVEYRMDRKYTGDEVLDDHRLTFAKATADDVMHVAKLDELVFQGDYPAMVERFKVTMQEKNREVWLAYLNGECIGKAHLLFDEDVICIHDIAITPLEQKKGYGLALLKWTVNYLIKTHPKKIYLEVEALNKSALKLYERCHFEMTREYECWKSPFEQVQNFLQK